MKVKIYIITLVFVFCGCNNQTIETDFKKPIIDTLQSALVNKQSQQIYIKDKSLYNKRFIEGILEFKEPIKLIENYILLEQDTIYFPEDIPLQKEILFQGKRGYKSFVLDLVRTNITTLNYNFRLFDDNNRKVLINKSGYAILGSMFFLASETDTDDKTGEEYLSNEYWDKSPSCSFAIRIGEKDDNGKLRAKVKLSFKNDTSKNIELNDNPTLRIILP